MSFKLVGKKITLRPPTKKDAAAIFDGAKDISVGRYTFVPHPYKIEYAVKFILESAKALKEGTAVQAAIIDNESGKLVGMIGVMNISKKHSRGEIGYWLHKKFRARGFVSEAVGLMIQYCFTELGFEKIVSGTMADNDISRRLLLKAGFKEEGLLRRHIKHRGRWQDFYRYGLLKSEWKG